MKVKHIAIAGLYAQLGVAVPHGVNHEHFHKRAVATAYTTVTDTVTVTDYNAIIWVDHAGNIVKTEHKTTSTTPATSLHLEPPSNSGIAAPNASPLSSTSSDRLVQSLGSFAAKDDKSDRIASPESSVHTSSPATQAIPSPSSSNVVNKGSAIIAGFGVAYDAWDGSNCRATLDSDFAFLSSLGATTIRIYDVCYTEAAKAASTHNLKLMAGVTMFDDFDNRLKRLVDGITSTAPGWSVVDTVFIGNELVNKGLATSSDVAGKVSYARGILKTKGWSGNVVTVDTWTQMRNDATICSTSDYCAANAHAFFDGNVLPSAAGSFVRMAQSQVAAKAGGKRVVITESGWPHAGAANGMAIPSVDNQRAAMASVVKEFASNPSDLFLFMAYDAKYKTGDAEIERNFGIFDADHYSGYL